jgi:hypothetical protein
MMPTDQTIIRLQFRFISHIPRPIHSNFDGSQIRCHLRWMRTDRYCQCKTFASSASSNKPEIAELGHLVRHGRHSIAQLSAVIFIIPCRKRDLCAVFDLTERRNLEGQRESFVGAPMPGQRRADKVWAAGANQFTRVFAEHSAEGSFSR